MAETDDRQTVGYILLTEVEIVSGGNAVTSLGVAPLAVLPEFQQQGVGGLLLQAAHQRAAALGYGSQSCWDTPRIIPVSAIAKPLISASNFLLTCLANVAWLSSYDPMRWQEYGEQSGIPTRLGNDKQRGKLFYFFLIFLYKVLYLRIRKSPPNFQFNWLIIIEKLSYIFYFENQTEVILIFTGLTFFAYTYSCYLNQV